MSENENMYIVFTEINGVSYSISVKSYSMLGAEHKILSLGVYDTIKNKHTVDNALAFDSDGMKTDYFSNMMINAQTVSFSELENIVNAINENAKKRAEMIAEKTRIEKEIARLQARLGELTLDLMEVVYCA